MYSASSHSAFDRACRLDKGSREFGVLPKHFWHVSCSRKCYPTNATLSIWPQPPAFYTSIDASRWADYVNMRIMSVWCYYLEIIDIFSLFAHYGGVCWGEGNAHIWYVKWKSTSSWVRKYSRNHFAQRTGWETWHWKVTPTNATLSFWPQPLAFYTLIDASRWAEYVNMRIMSVWCFLAEIFEVLWKRAFWNFDDS